MTEIPTYKIEGRLPRITNSFSPLSKTMKSQNSGQFSSTMVSLTKESGRWGCERAMGLKPGPTAANTSEIGGTTKPTARESYTTQTEMSTKANGSMTRQMDMELTLTQTAQSTSENGKMTNKTATELRNGQTDKSTKESTRTAPKQDKVSSNF